MKLHTANGEPIGLRMCAISTNRLLAQIYAGATKLFTPLLGGWSGYAHVISKASNTIHSLKRITDHVPPS